jgi:N-acetylglucosamine kinase-like BadF-type ATPase
VDVKDELPAVLAIDGGNSKTDLALIAEDGTLLATYRGPGSAAPDASTLAPLISELAALVGRDGSAPVARHISACLANVDLPEEEQRLSAELAGRNWSATSQVLNDTFALLRSGTQRSWGVAVVCGAGVNCRSQPGRPHCPVPGARPPHRGLGRRPLARQ